MQNKGLVKLFAVLFGLVSIYQLSFTIKANQIEDRAEQYAASKSDNPEQQEADEASYLDSISNQKVFNMGVANYTYNEVKEKAMNLGLDLKGGINVILEISVKDVLKGLANNSKDPVFNKALDDATELQKTSQNAYVDDFFIAFDKIKGDQKLASPDIFANRTLGEEITFDMSDRAVQVIIRKKVDESVISAFEVLRKRIDKFGVTSPNIQRLGNTGRILVELPGAKDVDRIQNLLQSTAQLEFWDVYKGEEFLPFLAQANETLKPLVNKGAQSEVADSEIVTDTIDDADSRIKELTGVIDTDSTEVGENPILDLLRGYGSGGPVVATFEAKDKDVIMGYLNMPQVRSLLSPDQRYVKFAWGIQAKNSEFIDLYAIKGNRDNTPELSGAVITDASQQYTQRNQPSVSMQMNSKGGKIWEEMTGRAYAQQSQIAIVLDDIVYSAPGVTTGPISGGNSEISGSFTLNEAIDLANVLRAGKLPAKAEIVQSEIVGPSLGAEAIQSSLISFVVSLLLVFSYMYVYYGRAGISADIALVVNLLLVFGVMAGLGAVLSLPGIAGIVLTIGMAVDANVLIFERIKEEMGKGKGLKEAVEDGYNNALSPILDANITSAIVGIILLIYGSGPIQGFATTLLIGIATSLFTSLFISKMVMDYYLRKGVQLKFTTSFSKGFFKDPNYDFLGKRKLFYGIIGAVLLVGIISFATQGLNQGVDFTGGRTYTVRFDQAVNSNEIQEELVDAFGSAEAKTFGGNNQLKITTKYKVEENSTEADNEVQLMLYEALRLHLPDGTSYEEFSSVEDEGKDVGIMQSMKVGPTIADDIKNNSVWAVLGSLVAMFLYILFRFRTWQYGLGAVIALFFDAFVVVTIFSAAYKFMPFSLEIDQNFIAAILTVVGYSINDKVVIFDRLREYFQEYPTWSKEKVVQAALNSTLSRTINTGLSVLLVLFAIFIFGGESLRGFVFALIIGVLVGVYSTLFVATPIMYDTMKDKNEKLPVGENKK